MRVWITGYFGAGNVGDEALLWAALTGKGHQSVVVVSEGSGRGDPIHGIGHFQQPPLEPGKGRFGLAYGSGYWLRRWPKALVERLRTKSCIYACGGALNDNVSGRLVQTRNRVRAWKSFGCRRVAMLGGGVDLCTHQADIEALKMLVEQEIDYISLRDPESKARLDEMGIDTGRVHVATDLAFALPRGESSAADRGCDELSQARVGLNLRPLYVSRAEKAGDDDVAPRSQAFLKQARILAKRLDELAAEVVLVAFSPHDVPLLEDLAESCNLRLLPYSPNPEVTLSHYDGLDMFVGMRFHSIVFAMLRSVPCLPIVNATKVLALGRQLGWDLESVCVGDGTYMPDKPLDAEAVVDLVSQGWARRDELLRSSEDLVARFREIARSDIQRSWDAITGNPDAQ
jgi:polysaccharide pyruvyl transferase WcaK-like protein